MTSKKKENMTAKRHLIAFITRHGAKQEVAYIINKQEIAFACRKSTRHAYLPMRLKYRKSSKPASCGFLFRPNIAPPINRAGTVFPACSLYNIHIICPVIIMHELAHSYNITYQNKCQMQLE